MLHNKECTMHFVVRMDGKWMFCEYMLICMSCSMMILCCLGKVIFVTCDDWSF